MNHFNLINNYFISKWLGPLLIIATGIMVISFTWGKWADILTDFGKEPFVAWQLSEGKVLYKDIAYYMGPFSPYFNSLIFRIFGTSLLTLVITNIFLLSILVYVLYRLSKILSNSFTATVACLAFLLLFACGHYLTVGSYNYICPYTHEMTHGLLLSLISLLCLWFFDQKKSLPYLWISGFCWGIVFLTKIEIFTALTAALSTYLFNLSYTRKLTSPKKTIFLLIIFSSLPFLFFLFFLNLRMSTGEVLNGMLSSWKEVLLNQSIVSSKFHQNIVGFDYPILRLKEILYTLGLYALILLPVFLGALYIKSKNLRFFCYCLTLPATITVFLVYWLNIPWTLFARPFPLILLILLTIFMINIIKYRNKISSQHILTTALIAFSLVLLLRMFLAVRLAHYGFVLAMPATMIIIILTIHWIPKWISRKQGYGTLFGSISLLLIIFVTMRHSYLTYERYEKKTYVVGQQNDVFKSDRRGQPLQNFLKKLKTFISSEQTLLCFLDGRMINYLNRLQPPDSPYLNFDPSVIQLYGEELILKSLKNHPPDFIALIDFKYIFAGNPQFGQDYGQKIFLWVKKTYTPIYQMASAPFETDEPGIQLLKKKSLIDKPTH